MPLEIVHLIADLNGYGETRQLQLLVGDQLAGGERVQVVALKAEATVLKAFRTLGVECRALQRRWTVDPIQAWRLSKVFLQTEPDVVHTWGETALNYGLAVSRGMSIPVVSTLFEAPRSEFWNWCRKQWSGQAAKTVVPNQRVEQDCRTNGFAQAEIEQIPLSVTGHTNTATSREQLRAELNVPMDTQLIAIAGPLVRSKRIDDAIWCFELIRTLEVKTHLVIFGDGPDRSRLERFTRLVSEPEAVSFLGYREDLLELLPHVDLLWQPGEETTLAGIMLEAMSVGVPVVASDVPVHQEVIEDGRTGYLFPVGSRAGCARQTQRILADADQRAAITTAAADWIATKHAPSAATIRYAEIYRQVATVEVD